MKILEQYCEDLKKNKAFRKRVEIFEAVFSKEELQKLLIPESKKFELQCRKEKELRRFILERTSEYENAREEFLKKFVY